MPTSVIIIADVTASFNSSGQHRNNRDARMGRKRPEDGAEQNKEENGGRGKAKSREMPHTYLPAFSSIQ